MQLNLAIPLHRVRERVAAITGPENGAAPLQDPPDRLPVELTPPGPVNQAVETVLNADHPPATIMRRPDRPADDCVQAGAISTAGEYGYGFRHVSSGIPGFSMTT